MTNILPTANSSSAGVKLFGGPRASNLLNIPETRSFHHEYNSLACTVEIVDDVHAAINHIHQHGRHVIISLTSFYFLFSLKLLAMKLVLFLSFFFNFFQTSFSAVLIQIALSQKILKLLKYFYIKLIGKLDFHMQFNM